MPKGKMRIITVNISEPHVAALKMLQDFGLYPSRSEAMRVALRDFILEELGVMKNTYHEDLVKEWNKVQKETVSNPSLKHKKEVIAKVLRKLNKEMNELEVKH
jgi:Arc/MetJ-type ribon-helix-helix transcriptional regulator